MASPPHNLEVPSCPGSCSAACQYNTDTRKPIWTYRDPRPCPYRDSSTWLSNPGAARREAEASASFLRSFSFDCPPIRLFRCRGGLHRPSSRAAVTVVVVLVCLVEGAVPCPGTPSRCALPFGFRPPSCRPPARRRRREDGDARLPRRCSMKRDCLSLPLPLPALARSLSKCWKTQNRRIAGICLVGEEIRSGVGGVPRLIEGERARSKSARGGRRETEHGGTHRVVAQRPSLTIKPSAARGHHTHTSSKVSLRVRFC